MEAGEKETQRGTVNNGVSAPNADKSGDGDVSINIKNAGTWGTWEELLLASAVKRHGLRWDAVSAEVQARAMLPPASCTPDACRVKYSDLNLRFEANAVSNDVPWIEELRSLRMAELKREVQQYDVSILSLQLKVKRLEEERERSVRSEEDLKKRKPRPSDLDAGKGVEPRGTDVEEERSVNESNSTCSERNKTAEKVCDDNNLLNGDGSRAGPGPDPDSSGKAGGETEDELKSRDDSVSQVSGEAQSSASLGRGKRKTVRGRDEAVKVGPVVGKTDPVVSGLLEMIRAHNHGPVFLSRLASQESDAYARVVRQHVDLETIESRLDQGYYHTNLAFYRDLLLLFTNAVVFFPKTSTEFAAAAELRSLVSIEMKNESQKSDSALLQTKKEFQKPRTVFYKHRVPSLASCGKRTPGKSKAEEPKSVSKKSSNAMDLKLKSEDRPVTGARSSRRTKKTPFKKPPINEAPKSEGKKAVEASSSEKKRNAAADFLKRIKTSPVDVKKSGRDIATKSKDKKQKSGEDSSAERDDAKAKEGAGASASGKRSREFKTKEASKKTRKRARR